MPTTTDADQAAIGQFQPLAGCAPYGSNGCYPSTLSITRILGEAVSKTKEEQTEKTNPEVLQCGIVMPIAAMDGVTADHWAEVKTIIIEAMNTLDSPRFSTALVSDADDVGVIQKRIVQGVYASDVVVCDVSGKNPNVMFELGMRLAFDKPTVIIKDDKTDYMFDTGVIEHLTYPRDLRFARIVDFKQLLAKKVLATYQASQRDPEHSTFLKNFGTFKVAHLTEKEASAEQVILESLAELQREVRAMRTFSAPGYSIPLDSPDAKALSLDEVQTILKDADKLLRYGGPDAMKELSMMRTLLRRISDTPSLPNTYSDKAEMILQNISPRSQKAAMDIIRNGTGAQPRSDAA
ncbi:hypothetical protein AB3X96_15950 [Paraburkholderia sp. BR13439]|uniref:hypothetical protein n=1 Tax=Paraburkholderia sp. BR13439 TaxID=3236996 RepID=UPI0034CE14B0